MSINEYATEGFFSRYGQESGRLHSIIISKRNTRRTEREQKMLNLDEGDECSF